MDVEKRRPTKDVWIAWKLTWIRRECAPNPNKIGNRTGIWRVASNSKKNSLLMVVFFSKNLMRQFVPEFFRNRNLLKKLPILSLPMFFGSHCYPELWKLFGTISQCVTLAYKEVSYVERYCHTFGSMMRPYWGDSLRGLGNTFLHNKSENFNSMYGILILMPKLCKVQLIVLLWSRPVSLFIMFRSYSSIV